MLLIHNFSDQLTLLELRLVILIPYIGAVTGAVTTPLDVVKTRLMVQVHTIFYFSYYFEGNLWERLNFGFLLSLS